SSRECPGPGQTTPPWPETSPPSACAAARTSVVCMFKFFREAGLKIKARADPAGPLQKRQFRACLEFATARINRYRSKRPQAEVCRRKTLILLKSRFRSYGHIAGMSEVIATFRAANGGYERTDPSTQTTNSSLRDFSQKCFEFAERHLDWVKVRRVLR